MKAPASFRSRMSTSSALSDATSQKDQSTLNSKYSRKIIRIFSVQWKLQKKTESSKREAVLRWLLVQSRRSGSRYILCTCVLVYRGLSLDELPSSQIIFSNELQTFRALKNLRNLEYVQLINSSTAIGLLEIVDPRSSSLLHRSKFYNTIFT